MDKEYEKSLKEYLKVLKKLKRRAIKKYGVKAADWFGV